MSEQSGNLEAGTTVQVGTHFERENIINFLLQQCDLKNIVIAGLQRENAELKKAAAVAVSTPTSV